MLVNHGKTESSSDFFWGTFCGAGINPSNSKVARVDEGSGDVARDASSISRVDIIGRVGSRKGADCSVNCSSFKYKGRCGTGEMGRVGKAIRSQGPISLSPLRSDTPHLSVWENPGVIILWQGVAGGQMIETERSGSECGRSRSRLLHYSGCRGSR